MFAAYLAMMMTNISMLITGMAMRKRFKVLAASVMFSQTVTKPTIAKFVGGGILAFHVWFILWWLTFDGLF